MLPCPSGGKSGSAPYGKPKPWTWKDVHGLAALAGVAEPWPCTLRELAWRAEAVRCDAWDRAALIALRISQGLLKGKFELADFHPFLKRSEPASWADAERKAETLPDMLTPEQFAEWRRKFEAKN